MEPVESTQPPFENSVGYKLTKPINLAQLTDEVEQAAKLDVVLLSQLGPTQPGQVSEDNPAQLWVVPASLDPSLLAQVVDAHTVNPDWGVPQALKNYSTAMAKLQDDPGVELSSEDIESLVRGLALQVGSILTASNEAPDVVPFLSA